MRTVLALVVSAALALSTNAYAIGSDPAFLGIEMQMGAPCEVTGVIAGGPAEAAGLTRNDFVLALDNVRVSSCNELTAQIISHSPGDQVRIEVQRNGARITAIATLTTRAAVLSRLLVGQPLAGKATDYDDNHELDLGDGNGATTILAWSDLSRCEGCAALIRRVVDAAQKPKRGVRAPLVRAVTNGDPTSLVDLHLYVGAPIVIAPEESFRRAGVNEADRVCFMVLDKSGVVRFVATIVPDDDAIDASIDDLLAAVEQIERARQPR